MSPASDSVWEKRVAELAAAFAYPATPDLAARSGAALPAPRLTRRAAWSYAAALLALLAVGVLAVPQARASVIEFLRVGAIRLILGPATATPVASPIPIVTPTGRALSGRTTLAQARALARFPILLPAYPAGLGPPDEVYFQQVEGQVVVTVWYAGGAPGIALYHITERDFALKAVEIVEQTTVSGLRALWVRGPHLAQFQDFRVGEVQFVAGNVLIWTQGEVTYRLESQLSLEEAVRIAESLH
ncbi:MAG: hypothetical protein ACRDHY_09815 [Anaerolineales bacterium]